MNEYLTIGGGILIGQLLLLIPTSYRVLIGLPVILALGIIAALVSGEAAISWSFFLFDIVLVAYSSFASFTCGYYLHMTREKRA